MCLVMIISNNNPPRFFLSPTHRIYHHSVLCILLTYVIDWSSQERDAKYRDFFTNLFTKHNSVLHTVYTQ